ncbi:ribonuclease-III-like-domain-containing protein, partial [Pyronema domesticum]
YSNPEYIQNARPQPRAPVAPRARKHFQVNDDPAVLNRMYLKLFGKEMGLSEEVKWQAVTHKSFDHGRQPFNSKLRFFGKRLLQMHASLSLLNSQPTNSTEEAKPTVYKSLEGAHYQNPEPFVHEDFKNIDAVTQENIEKALDSGLLMPIIKESGLADVMRWKPADGNDLLRSGQGIIAIECFHAIVGALALQKGGEVAAQFIKEKVLKA